MNLSQLQKKSNEIQTRIPKLNDLEIMLGEIQEESFDPELESLKQDLKKQMSKAQESVQAQAMKEARA